jgi:hypothetical protein
LSHPDVAGVLAKLDPNEQEVVRHALSCPTCSSGLRGPLFELASLGDQLERIGGELRRLCNSLSCKSAMRARLECLLADRFEPGIRDLESIVETAQGDLSVVECQ